MPRPRILNHDKAYELYRQGLIDDDIAGRCCVSRRTVQAWRLGCGLPCNGRRPKKKQAAPKSQLAADAAEARAHGMNYGVYYSKYIAPRRQSKAGRKRGGKS